MAGCGSTPTAPAGVAPEIKGTSNNRTSWTDGALWLTTDWTLVVRTLGDGAFPLMTLEEALRAPVGLEALDDWCAGPRCARRSWTQSSIRSTARAAWTGSTP